MLGQTGRQATLAIASAALLRLGLDDSENRIAKAMATFPRDCVIEAIAIYEGKQAAGSLPVFASHHLAGRYLLVITRNLCQSREGRVVAESLWRQRRGALAGVAEYIASELHALGKRARSHEALLHTVVKRAINAPHQLERNLWLCAAAEKLRRTPAPRQEALYHSSALQLLAAYTLPYVARLAALRAFAAYLQPTEDDDSAAGDGAAL
jgi:hypothetical protein